MHDKSLQRESSVLMRSLNWKRYNLLRYINFISSHKVKTAISEISVSHSEKQGTEVTLYIGFVLLLRAHNNVITRDIRALTTDGT